MPLPLYLRNKHTNKYNSLVSWSRGIHGPNLKCLTAVRDRNKKALSLLMLQLCKRCHGFNIVSETLTIRNVSHFFPPALK